jgi:diacylglycerol kinase (ATP)
MASKQSVAVVAHSGKTLGRGLSELRKVLAEAGHRRPIWYEVPKSSKASKAVQRAVKKGAKLIFVWGGDGMVRRCIDALAGKKKVEIAILPAGTANLLATSLGIPKHIGKAVHIGLNGARRKLDVGVVNGERFAVMAGAGFDAMVMRGVDAAGKKRLGRLAYVRSGVKALKARAVRMTVRVDGTLWFKGKASAALIGNIGTVARGVAVFPDASTSDGLLEVGVVTASSVWQWVRVLSRVARGRPDRSPFVEMTRGENIEIELGRRLSYELDGGLRPPARRLKVRAKADAITVCVPTPRAATRVSHARRAPRRPTVGKPAPPGADRSVQGGPDELAAPQSNF